MRGKRRSLESVEGVVLSLWETTGVARDAGRHGAQPVVQFAQREAVGGSPVVEHAHVLAVLRGFPVPVGGGERLAGAVDAPARVSGGGPVHGAYRPAAMTPPARSENTSAKAETTVSSTAAMGTGRPVHSASEVTSRSGMPQGTMVAK